MAVRAERAMQQPRAVVSLDAKARFFKGLANGNRLRIIEALAVGEKSVGELVRETKQGQAQVSAALGCLRWCGFVRSRQDGRFVYYALISDRITEILRLAEALVAANAAHLFSCVVLDEEPDDVTGLGVAPIAGRTE